MKLAISKKNLIYTSLSGFFALLLGIILGYKVFPAVIRKKVWEKTVLEENTEQWDTFKKVPFPFDFKVYLFNVVNPEGIMNGEKPIVNEVGPFIYDLYRWKSDIEWSENKEFISFYEWSRFEFNREKSGSLTEDYEVTILNSAYNALFITVEELSPNGLEAISSQTPYIFDEKYDKLFIKIKVRDLLFDGMPLCVDSDSKGFLPSTICKQMKAKAGKGLRIEGNMLKAAHMYHKNMTHMGRFTIYSGQKEKEKVATVYKYENSSFIKTWIGGDKSNCNKMRGVISFPAFITKDMQFDTFGEDICKIMTLAYNKTETVKGIKGYKFVAKNNSFEGPKPHEENMCYCINRSRDMEGKQECFKDGILDLTNCLGSQIILSFPHLLYADKSYINSVNGISPNVTKHETYVTLEPHTGAPLKLAKRVQFNMFLRAFPDVDVFENVTNALLPMMWIEESVTLPDILTNMVKDQLLSKLMILNLLKWFLILVGSLALVISSSLLLYLR